MRERVAIVIADALWDRAEANMNNETGPTVADIADRVLATIEFDATYTELVRAVALIEHYGEFIVKIGDVLNGEYSSASKIMRIRTALAALAPEGEKNA